MAGSLALDARQGVLLVIGRWYYRRLGKNSYGLPSQGIYEHLLGLADDRGGGGEHCAKALKEALESACIIRRGRRNRDGVTGQLDQLDADLLKNAKASLAGANSKVLD